MIVPCYYIINLACFICIYMLFYMIFGTNLLTQSPVPVLFFPCFRVSQKRKIKRSSVDLKLHGTYFWTRKRPWSKRVEPEESRAAHEGGGCAYPLGAPSCLVASLLRHRLHVQVFWFAFCPRKIIAKVSFRLDSVLDSVWYSFL